MLNEGDKGMADKPFSSLYSLTNSYKRYSSSLMQAWEVYDLPWPPRAFTNRRMTKVLNMSILFLLTLRELKKLPEVEKEVQATSD
jgi:hypothetical protein